METRKQFQTRVQCMLEKIGTTIFSFNEAEYWLFQDVYEYIEFYAVEHRLWNTSIALPLSRALHDGSYRKSSYVKDGVKYRLPYFIHPLLVCRMLADLQVPLSNDEEDILLASALCHDLVEDIDFPEHGRELVTQYHLDERVYQTVFKVSKRRDFTKEEECIFFHQMEKDRLAVLVKLSDRGNNVEDLYNMSRWKVHEYVGETKEYFLPMCLYAKEHYPEIRIAIEILEDKMICLTEAAETLVDRYSEKEEKLMREVQMLREENMALRATWKKLWLGKEI